MTGHELISRLRKYDLDLEVVIVDEFGKPFYVSYCSPQRLDESGEMFDHDGEDVISIWPES